VAKNFSNLTYLRHRVITPENSEIFSLKSKLLDIAIGKGRRKAIHHYREQSCRPQIFTGKVGRACRCRNTVEHSKERTQSQRREFVISEAL